jgi:hypothetical protein
MNSQERAVRDILAKKAAVPRDSFEVCILPAGVGKFEIQIRTRDLDEAAIKRLDTVMKRATQRTPYAFYIAMAAFAIDALVFRSWWCLAWLLLAWLLMPREQSPKARSV